MANRIWGQIKLDKQDSPSAVETSTVAPCPTAAHSSTAYSHTPPAVAQPRHG